MNQAGLITLAEFISHKQTRKIEQNHPEERKTLLYFQPKYNICYKINKNSLYVYFRFLRDLLQDNKID